MVFVVISRTALVTMPIMLALFAAALSAMADRLSSRLRARAACRRALVDVAQLRSTAQNSSRLSGYTRPEQRDGHRLAADLLAEVAGFFAEAPVIGHGTGSTRGLFEKAARRRSGAHGMVVSDPHNQTLNVAVQWGAIGVVVLYAMWLLICCCFAARGWRAGSGCWWWCKIFSPRCSIRICSISSRAGCTCSASASPAAWRWRSARQALGRPAACRRRVRVEIATVATTAAANSTICGVIGLADEVRRQREGDEGLQQLHLRHPRDAAHRQCRHSRRRSRSIAKTARRRAAPARASARCGQICGHGERRRRQRDRQRDHQHPADDFPARHARR